MVAHLARNWSARFVVPVARFLGSLGLTPNGVTVLGFLLTLAVAAVLAAGYVQLSGVLLIVTLAFDAVDGTLARLTGRASRFGAFLDSTLDRWAEAALFSALIWQFLRSGNDSGVLLATVAMATSFLVSYTRARAEGIGVQCKEGILTRFERLVLLIGGLILNQVVLVLWLIAILAGITAVQRMWLTWQTERDSP